jgi:nitrogen regulatory protein PII/signal recognition particle receptor subunit beta
MVKKIMVLGASGSGKKTALKYLMNENIEIEIFDYGKAIIGGKTAYLFSSAQSQGFIFAEELLSSHLDGIIIFIDNELGINDTDLEIIDSIDKKSIPFVIFANKQDLNNSIFNIDYEVLVIPTIATEGKGVKDGLKMFLKLIESQNRDETNCERSMKDIVRDIKRLKSENDEKTQCIQELANKFEPINRDNFHFCKIKIFLHPIELDHVKEALENVGFSNLTVIEVGYVESNVTTKESYRGKDYSLNIPKRDEINLVIKHEDIKYIFDAVKSIKNEDIYDNIFISPIENVIRIRTEERGEEAIE